MNYYDALRAIARPIRAVDMPRSLEPMRRLLAELGNPERAFQSIVVTGSVGKGTTAHQIAALLSPHHPTGLFTGPHLHSFRERFAINTHLISKEAFTQGIQTVLLAAERLELPYSTFELATALAIWWFAENHVKLAVLEVGIGGRWDAVNAVPNVLAVITPIESEHVAMLGGSLQTIAYHKAGIIQPRGTVVSASQVAQVEDVLNEEANFQQANIYYSDNLAVMARQSLIERSIIPNMDLPAQPPQVHLPGRTERVEINGREIVIDGGHTVMGAKRLYHAINQWYGEKQPVYLVIGMLRDKAAHDFLHVFDEPRFRITITTAPGHRATAPDELFKQAEFQRAQVEVQPDLMSALKQAEQASGDIIVTGSLRMAATTREAFGLLTPNELDEAQQTRAIFEGESYLNQLK